MSPVAGSLLRGRLRSARGRPAAVVLALAVAVLIPVLISASTQVTARATLDHALGGLPVGQRSAIVSFNGFLEPAELAAMDSIARGRLPDLVTGPIRRQLVYRPLADGSGTDFVLAATDDLAGAVRLTSGRMPRSCTPTRCEVVELPAGAGAVPRVGKLNLVIVGTVERSDPFLLSGTFDTGTKTPGLLADGVEVVTGVAAFSAIGHTYGWVAELDRGVISDQGADGWGSIVASVEDALVRGRPGTILTVPETEVVDQLGRADDSARRFSLLAGGCGLLLLGAAMIGGAALRPDTLRFAEALRRRGLGPVRIRLVVLAEVLVLVLVAAGLGLLAGAGAAAGPSVSPATALAQALPTVIGLLIAAFGLLAIVLWGGSTAAGWRTVTWVAVGCLMALVLIISRGAADPDSGRGDPLLVALPALLLLTVALLAARTWPWLVRIADRLLPRRAVGARLAVAGIAGRPLIAASCLALLVAAIGATGFAASYRATLERGAQDQAAFAVPTDARITPGTGLRPVLSVASRADYPGVAIPVLRQAGSVRVKAGQTDAIQLVGTDPAELPRVRRWSAVVGGSAPQTVAERIAAPDQPAGVALPAGRELTIGLTRDLPAVEVVAWLQAADGRERAVPLKVSDGALRGSLPEEGGWALASLSASQSEEEATHRQHQLGENDSTTEVPSGTIGLGSISVEGKAVEPHWEGITGGFWRYRLTQSTARLWTTPVPPGAPGSPASLKVAADPITAAQSPTLTLTVAGQTVTAQVVATLPRFPTVSGRFVLADVAALGPVFSRLTPGSGQPGELWLAQTGPGVALPEGVSAQWYTDVERSLRTDPVAEGAERVLFLTALATLIVALAGVVLLVVGERTEDAAEFLTWEAGGVRPRVLRRALWGRAVLIVAVAVPAGVLAGLILTVLTARLVRLTAGAQVAQPPLVPVVGATTAIPLVLGAFVIALGVAGLVAMASFREAEPR
jgi:hypothetical protein